MALFTAAAVATAIGVAEGAFIATAVAFTLNAAVSLAASIGISYAVKALAGDQNANAQKSLGVQGKLAGGGSVPRSFGLGYHVTGGSLVYANQSFGSYDTPNALFTQVIALSDLPGERLLRLWVNGALVTLPANAADYQTRGYNDVGYPISEYTAPVGGDGPVLPHLWVKYYDGTQTQADGFMQSSVSSAERPYGSTRVGKGVCYLIVHAFSNDNLWQGFPTVKAELSGVPLYDPSKDDTVGGDGDHRYDDPETWGGDGDQFPVVQIYNILRGFYYDGQWLYGLQNTAGARLPVENWITQIEKCRATVEGEDGPEPTYRSGSQIDVDVQPANAIEGFLSACQGKVSEIGGFYKIHVGAPDSPTFSFTDDDILSTETQTYRPFLSLADSVNGIQATYPDPAQNWSMATAPALYRTDLEARDGNRRLMANPQFAAVPYPEQVQRLQKSAIEEAQRARSHTITLPPAYWLVEPGDVGEWTSVRNGYDAKQFRTDAVVDKANLDVTLTLTEVDPSDYDWDRDTDLQPVTGGGGVTFVPLPAQGVTGWTVQPYTLYDAAGIVRRPAILILWDGTQPGIAGIQYEVRLTEDESDVTAARVDRPTAGNAIISQGILPDTAYQVRARFIPSSPRNMEWSDWEDVTTPDVRFSLSDFSDAVVAQINGIEQFDGAELQKAIDLIASIVANQDARNWLDKKEVRSQLSATHNEALAQIDEVRTVAVDTELAFASFSMAATATFGGTTAFVGQTATAIATFEGYAASSWAVTVDVGNGTVGGLQLINGSDTIPAFIVTVDKFQVAAPGVSGGDPVPMLTVANVAGSPKVVFRGDMYGDGSINVNSVTAGSLDALSGNMGTLTAGKIQSSDSKFLIDCDNKRIVISD